MRGASFGRFGRRQCITPGRLRPFFCAAARVLTLLAVVLAAGSCSWSARPVYDGTAEAPGRPRPASGRTGCPRPLPTDICLDSFLSRHSYPFSGPVLLALRALLVPGLLAEKVRRSPLSFSYRVGLRPQE